MMRKSSLLLGMALVALLLGGCLPRRPPLEQVTTPLPAEVVADVCQRLELAPDQPPCRVAKPVYAQDFAYAIRDSKQRLGLRSYADVQARFGPYQFKCGPMVTQANGVTYYRCHYDLRGDRVYRFAFSFLDDDSLDRVYWSPTGS